MLRCMHNFLRVGDKGDALLILTVGIVQPPYQKQKITVPLKHSSIGRSFVHSSMYMADEEGSKTAYNFIVFRSIHFSIFGAASTHPIYV
jgi:hypothetical protein